jgi:hypothetical protein
LIGQINSSGPSRLSLAEIILGSTEINRCEWFVSIAGKVLERRVREGFAEDAKKDAAVQVIVL